MGALIGTDGLLLQMTAMDADLAAQACRDAAETTDDRFKADLEHIFARVFAGIDAVIWRLQLDHREISRLAELESQRLGLVGAPRLPMRMGA